MYLGRLNLGSLTFSEAVALDDVICDRACNDLAKNLVLARMGAAHNDAAPTAIAKPARFRRPAADHLQTGFPIHVRVPPFLKNNPSFPNKRGLQVCQPASNKDNPADVYSVSNRMADK
ncbi:MAG TPA: hypothetical protein VGL53_29670 [Bryobacteraceae bacterium]